jgi:hypothetical protein
MYRNLKIVKPKSETRSYQLLKSPNRPHPVVVKAIERFLPSDEVADIISNFRRSEVTEERLIEDFHECNFEKFEITKDDIYYQGLQILQDLFKPTEKLRPVHFCDLRYYDWNYSTSVEPPFCDDQELKKRISEAAARGDLPHSRMSFGNCRNEVFERARGTIHVIKDGRSKGNTHFYYIKTHSRSHLVEQDEPDKIRSVNGVPKTTLFAELMFFWPYYNFLRKGTTPILWGYETFNGGLYKIANEASAFGDHLKWFLCIDWKKFDKRALFVVIDDIYKMLRSFYDFNHGYIPTTDYRSSTTESFRLENLWKWMVQAVKFTPIRLPDGSEWKRSYGTIPSGMMNTQVLDSLYNAFMIIVCLLDMGYEVTHELFLKVLGDDSLVGLTNLLTFDDPESFLAEVALVAQRRFNAILNVKKSKIRTNLQGIDLLGYENDNCVPKRARRRLLAQLAFPERYSDYSRMASRAIGIAWASCGQDRVLYNICEDVYKFCTRIGGEPDVLGAGWLCQVPELIDIDLKKFPTFQEISNRLFDPNVHMSDGYWPTDHFLSEI